MSLTMNRRQFLCQSATATIVMPGITGLSASTAGGPGSAGPAVARIKTSLNAYSFNTPLRAGQMSLVELLDFTAECGFDAIDITGYYFPGYPATPERTIVNAFKRNAFLRGLEISGTGVRNDFTTNDTARREADVVLVRKWIELAAELGAPVIRVFAGKSVLEGPDWQEAAKRVADGLQRCAQYGEQHGVMVALQNHGEFLRTSEQVIALMEMVSSDWLGLMLDIGSYLTADPYQDIADTVPYAITWQVKENVRMNGQSTKTDLRKVIELALAGNYRGYMPLETLGEGDPKSKVRNLLQAFQAALVELR